MAVEIDVLYSVTYKLFAVTWPWVYCMAVMWYTYTVTQELLDKTLCERPLNLSRSGLQRELV